jgi:medium-chain acyl-[acyl-carrier-protein] hydrolase
MHHPPLRDPASPWIVSPRPLSTARTRLFCFGYAGSGPTLFHTWPQYLGRDCEVCAIHLPGRENRIREPRMTDLIPLVRLLALEMLPFLDRPFVCFGHSLGALLAFEVVRRLRSEYQRNPNLLVVSGRGAPQRSLRANKLHRLNDEDLVRAVKDLQGTDPAVLDNAELVKLILPVLRADFTLCETYQYQHDRPLDCPIMAFGGTLDGEVPSDALQAWRVQTTGDFRAHMFDGSHFFIHTMKGPVLHSLACELQRYCGPENPSWRGDVMYSHME